MLAERDIYIIAYYPSGCDFDPVFFSKYDEMNVIFTKCKLSARRYLTYKGACKSMDALIDYLEKPKELYKIVNIKDLVHWYG